MPRGAALDGAVSAVRVVAAALIATMLAGGLATTPAAAHDDHTTTVGGQDPVGIAVELSRMARPDAGTSATEGDAAERVLLGRDDLFSDLLAAGSATGQQVLLTPTGQLDPRTADELERLGAEEVTIVGGTAAVSPDVAAALAERGYRVRRLSGTTRVETAVAVARAHHPEVRGSVILARSGGDGSRAFADVLGGSALAHARSAPVVVTPTGQLHDAVADYLRDAGAREVIIAGGPDAVSPVVARQIEALGITVRRASGASRASTAIAQNRQRGLEVARQASSVLLLNGYHPRAWAPGFAAGAWAAASDTAVALATGDGIDSMTAAFLGGSDHVELVCGPTVSGRACDAAQRAMDLPPFAEVGGVTLRQLSTGVELIGFHEANHDGARQLTPHPAAPPITTLDSRGRPTGSRSAADIVAHPHRAVRAPVTGTVVRSGTYRLYCDYSDDYAVIEPDAHPGWEVKLLHIDGVRVEPGDRVHAGTTVVAPRPTRLPFGSQVDRHSAPRDWPHVHLEVVDPSIPDESSGSC